MRINRRTLLGSLLVASVPNSSALASMYIPYSGNIALPGPLATCEKIRSIIADAYAFKESLSQDQVVDHLIQRQVDTVKKLDAEIAATTKAIQSAEKIIIIQQIGLVAGIVFTGAGFVATSPLAVGALLGLQIVGGTTLVAVQAIYDKSSAPSILLAYSKDRVLVFGEPIAESAGSSGGKMALRVLGIASLLVDALMLNSANADIEQLRQKAKNLQNEASLYRDLLKRYPAKARGPWRAMFQTSVSGTINALERLVNENAHNNCLVPAATGPVLRLP